MSHRGGARLASWPSRVFRPTLVVAALLSGCAATPPDSTTGDEPGTQTAALAAPQLEQVWPISTAYYRTTSADIYFGNLDARIQSLESRVAAGHGDRAEALAGQLYHRYKLRGRLADSDRATALLTERADAGWLTPSGMVLYAIALSGQHRFDEAEAWLARAREAGAKPEELRDVQADIVVARGDYARLAPELATSAQPIPDFYALAHRADLRLLQGDLKGAERHYLAAQTQYNDSNPVPLAWLHTQMGIAYLRFGEIENARRFFAAAVDRLPGYTLAEEHLAECETLLGDYDTARARYERVIATSDNPEYIAALSDLERRAGNPERAAALAAEAEAGYDALLKTAPAAYSQHAAEFYVERGKPERAYALAKANAEVRSDVGTLILLATTANAAAEQAVACEARSAALATGLAPPELGDLEELAATCAAQADAPRRAG